MSTPKTLRDLLLEHIDRTGDSYSDIAKKTGLSKSAVGILVASTAPRGYRAGTVDKIARGLRLPREVVARAASATAGLSVDEPDTPSGREDARVITELLDDLGDDDLATLRAMIYALVEHRGR